MEIDLLKHLNSIQKKAVTKTEGPIIILAGAGSGKTRVLTYKVAYLILKKRVSPKNILMATFTNKAANEMKERVLKIIADEKKESLLSSSFLPFAGTFHSLCAKILRTKGKAIDISSNFVIYDEKDRRELIKDIVLGFNLDLKRFHPNILVSIISNAKNELVNALEYLNIAQGFFQKEVAKIYLQYEKSLKLNNALDFDDLILKTIELLDKNQQTAQYYQDLFRYILIDEYQDTNHAQYLLTKILAKRWKNICVVGDAAQSIYNFRGADFRNILNFQKDYPNVSIFNLVQNYRSTQNILDAAYSIISNNQSHPILKLWTTKNRGEKIVVYQAEDEHDEALFVTNQLQKLVSSNKSFSYSKAAILYRTNAQSRAVEEALLQKGLPYCLVGGVKFYERKEIKDIISFLKLLINPKDSLSYKRIEKLGKKKLESFLQFSKQYNLHSNQKELTTLDILDQLLKTTKYLNKFDRENPEDLSLLENIMELRSVATKFTKLNNFLENISLLELEYLPSDKAIYHHHINTITLMTIHAAKGLEFNHVFLVGMEEGLFPHAKALFESDSLEEERRLCYVGITRAKERLYLTYAKKRLYFGKINFNQISRFLSEIPPELIFFTSNNTV